MILEKVESVETVQIFGVNIINFDENSALEYMQKVVLASKDQPCCMFFVNSHTLNIAYENLEYKNILNSSSVTFGDGTGVRWGARTSGQKMKANLNGTDLVPQFLSHAREYDLRVFLLGGRPKLIESAANYLTKNFLRVQVSGFHHGYFTEDDNDDIIQFINSTHPHVLLVGMGNPNQEVWIHNNRNKIKVPLVIGVGGLFHYWAGDLTRAPKYLREFGMEWLGILLQQPHKWERYIKYSPRFLARIIKYKFTQK